MSMYQLPVPIPVRVVGGRGWTGPTGTGLAVGWFQPHLEHHLFWLVLMGGGEFWEVPNVCIRAEGNVSLRRPPVEEQQRDGAGG